MNVKAKEELRNEKTYEEYCEEFIIKDNVGFGEWDWDLIANQWDDKPLDAWGLDHNLSEDDKEEMNNPENEDTENIFATELDQESNYIVLKFSTDIDWLQAKTLFKLKTETAKRANGKEWAKGIGRVLQGSKAIKIIQNES